MTSPFDCRCGHPIHKHNTKVWPSWVAGCDVCECKAYEGKRESDGIPA